MVQPPGDDDARLAILRQYDILDTAPDKAFDDLARLAASLCGTPIGQINFIDAARQWSKASTTPVPDVPRDAAFCAQAILQPDLLIVPDLQADERFATNPFVTAHPRLRFYAGAPLTTADGYALGTLCVMDVVPRDLTPEQRGSLRTLGRQVMTQLELRRAVTALEGTVAARQEAEDALHRQLAFTRAMTSSVGDGVYALDRDGRLTFINAAAQRMLGWTEAELLGAPMHETIHFQRTDGTRVPAEECPLLGVIRSGIMVRADEDVFTRRDGTMFSVAYTSSPIMLDGQVAGAVLTFSDTTARKRAEERLRLLESVVVNANDAVLITEAEPIDPPGPRVLFVNEAFTRMTGYRPDEVIGQTPRMLQGPETDRAALDKIRQALTRWKPVRVEVVNHHRDGTPFWVELNIVPIADEQGWFTHWVSVQRETTARKQAEKALERARDDAEQANQAKSDFLSRMSHELRTPLNAVLGFAQLLDMDAVDAEQRDSVEHILKAGRHLLTLINEVLDIARIEAGRLALSLEPVNVREILREARSLLAPLAAGRAIHLDADVTKTCDRHVLADRQRIKQVLLNLLSNAVKYTRAGDVVVLSCAETGAGRLRITVRDTGPGIPADRLGRLFTPFDRLGAEGTGVEGSGIGLALSQRLMEAMGGTITVESEVGRGSAFTVELSLAEPPLALLGQTEADVVVPAPGPGVGRTVLYIEDNLSNFQLVRRILAARPRITLLSAMQGRLGLDLAREHAPDLILLDLHLPDLAGEEVLRQVRDTAATRDIPVVVISADATPGQIDRLLAAGAAHFLTKPFDVGHFLAIVDDTLRDDSAPPAGGR